MTIRLCRDDIIPRAVDAGILATLASYAAQNKSDEDVIDYLTTVGDPQNLTWDQVKEVLADAVLAGVSGADTIKLYGDSLPEGTARAAAPSGLGVGNGNVWFGTPSPATGSWRFYVNGVLKTTLTDYYITSLASIQAGPGDIVQICQVVDGVVGWWARITVP